MTTHDTPFSSWTPLEQPRLGTRVTWASDDFFADKSRLIDPAEPVFIDGKYDDRGKWMDGWESRRKRSPGHDACIVRLGVPAIIRGLIIDTSHFTGNYPPEASVDWCVSDDDVPNGGWQELVPRMDLDGDAKHPIEVDPKGAVTHLRLNIFPDGGVARLRIFGEVQPDLSKREGSLDLVALHNGGRPLAASDEHYGSKHNLILPERGVNMGDGWETARRRGPGNDWVIIALGAPGIVESIEVDTAHFKGNYPDRVSIEAGAFANHQDAIEATQHWATLLPEAKLEMDQQHTFKEELAHLRPISHVRMSIFPDGGVSRLRVYGRLAHGDRS